MPFRRSHTDLMWEGKGKTKLTALKAFNLWNDRMNFAYSGAVVLLLLLRHSPLSKKGFRERERLHDTSPQMPRNLCWVTQDESTVQRYMDFQKRTVLFRLHLEYHAQLCAIFLTNWNAFNGGGWKWLGGCVLKISPLKIFWRKWVCLVWMREGYGETW